MKKLFMMVMVLVILASGSAEASRRGKSVYEQCQTTLEELIKHVDKTMESESGFPPKFLRVDPVTGEIPLEVLEEQALISNFAAQKLIYPDCRYAVAPWALSGEGAKNAKGHDIYCVSHGFIDHLNRNLKDADASVESARSYFIASCQKNGIDTALWQKNIDALDPDIHSLKRLSPLHRAFARAVLVAGPFAIALIQLLVALAGAMLFWRRSGNWRLDFWPGLTAAAGLWVGLQAVYLLLVQGFAIEARTMLLVGRPAGQIFAIQELSCFFLLIFFIAMIFSFRKRQKATGPVIAMLFAVFREFFSATL